MAEPGRATEARPPLDARLVRHQIGARGITVRLPYSSEEGIFGLGLQLHSHLQSGKKKHLRVNADPVADTGDSHAPVPFYASSRGYAVLIDTARYCSLYIGTHSPVHRLRERLREKWHRPALAPEELYRGVAIGEEIVVDIPVAQGVVLYLFDGPWMGDAIARYNRFSGGGFLPPLWALGNWYRACSALPADQIERLVSTFEADRLPFSVLGLEPGWQSHFYPNSFTWEAKRFPAPADFIQRMRAKGLRLNLWENPFVHPDAPFADEIRPVCGDALSTDGLAPDFLEPRARSIFADHHRALVEQGVAGFKLDECDNGDFIPFAWSFPEHTNFPSGADGEQMHCLYGVHYQHTIAEVFSQRGLRQLDLVRSSGALAASLPYVLYSDLYGHAEFLRGLVTAAYSGLLWTPELRHASSIEDLIRRLQAVVLSPLSLINGWYCNLPPWWQWNKELNQQGVEMPERAEVTALVRAQLELRIRLIPVLYTAFERYRRTGVPPVRGLPFDTPQDKRLWSCDRAFMIGRDLLAAPLMAGERDLSLPLPAGIWRDFETGATFEGGRTVTLENVPLARIPLFVRDGTLLPLVENPAGWNPDAPQHPLCVHVYAAETAEGELYEDDGLTRPGSDTPARWSRLFWSAKRGLTQTTVRETPGAPSLFPVQSVIRPGSPAD